MKPVTELHKKKTRKPLLFISMISIVMLFIGFTSGYIVRMAEGNWMAFDLPDAFFISTAVIILSSLVIQKSLQAARLNDFESVKRFLGITFLLGISFTILQFEGWSEMRNMGVFFTGENSNAAGSFVYVITLVHLIHLIAGLISILVMYLNSRKNKYTKGNTLGLELGVIFWHFLGGLWIYLFLFFLFTR
jgi:cytochrome c oxidase subunit 3